MTKPHSKETPEQTAKRAARVLKRKGLIPGWDLRKPLTAGQKSYLTKQRVKYAQIVRHPDQFDIRRVKPETVKNLKRLGFATHKGKVIVPTRGQKVNIVRGKVIIRESGRRVEIYLAAGPDLLDRIKSSIAKGEPRLNRGQFWTVRLGGDNWSVTGNTYYNSLAEISGEMHKYLERLDLAPYLSIAKTTIIDDDIDDESEIESNI